MKQKKRQFPIKIFLIMVILDALLMAFVTFLGIRSWFPVSNGVLAVVFLVGTAVLAGITALSFLWNPPDGKEPRS